MDFLEKAILLCCLYFSLAYSCLAQRCDTYNYNKGLAAKTTPSDSHDFGFSARDTNSNEVITIPVVIHVLYNTAAQNISDAQILSQLKSLNNDYRKVNADS